MTCQVRARIDSSRYVRLLRESDDDRNGHAAIFEVKFGVKTERTAPLFDTLELVAQAL